MHYARPKMNGRESDALASGVQEAVILAFEGLTATVPHADSHACTFKHARTHTGTYMHTLAVY